jgi:DNA-(apurinic or apyrimidinic site) lyase
MTELQSLIAKIMKANNQSKTIVFAIKMFGYATQIITKQETIYPMKISIPIDSRIKTIYKNQFPNINHNDNQVQQYFDELSLKNNIPPLHLDSILWLDYWNKIVKKQ